jgi:hypothetical protein
MHESRKLFGESRDPLRFCVSPVFRHFCLYGIFGGDVTLFYLFIVIFVHDTGQEETYSIIYDG